MIEIGLDGMRYTFKNLESAYQAFKCPERMYEFQNLSPKEAVALGKTVALRPDWDDVKGYVYNYLLYVKYEKGIDRDTLLATSKNKIKDAALLAVREKCKSGYTIDHNANFLCKDYCEMKDAQRIGQQAEGVRPLSMDKIMHCSGVAKVCMESASKYGLDPAQMYTVGLLHDIGYVYGRGNHEIHGAELLENMGLTEDYVYGITLHGKSPKDIDLTNASDAQIKCLVALYEADMSVDTKGHIIGFEKRLEDIKLRYGKDHIASKAAAAEIEFVEKYLEEHNIEHLKINKEEVSLFGVTEGIICQQCNCIGVYGAGISGAISKEFPEVLNDFKEEFEKNKGNQFGTYRLIKLSDNLYVANIYSQDKIISKTNKTPTDIGVLVNCIKQISEDNLNLNVYLPHSKNIEHDGIGCGLGGAKWSDLVTALQKEGSFNLYALNTLQGMVGENIMDIDVTKIEDYGKDEPAAPKRSRKTAEVEKE